MQKAIQLAEEYGMLPRDELVLCAVSGGADSVCLLHLLQALSGSMGFRLAAAHFNHMLRGDASDGDEAFVRSLCLSWGIPFYAGRGDVRKAREKGRGLEETARALRYAFLRRTAQATGASLIATAHTADDNAETILMRLVRGSGLRGLCGIPPRREEIVRPLLTTSRSEISAYLKERGLSHREDESNRDPSFTRNRLRQEALPVLRSLNPRLNETMAAAAASLRADLAFIEGEAEPYAHFIVAEGKSRRIAANVLKDLPKAVSSRLIRTALHSAGAGLQDVGAAHIAAILDLCKGERPSARISLPGGVTVRRDYGDLLFTTAPPRPQTFSPALLNYTGETAIPGAPFHIFSSLGKMQDGNLQSGNTFWLKYDIIAAPLQVRPRAPGDRLSLPHRSCSRSLKKLMIDEKVPRHLRELIPVISAGDRVAAVAGFGPDKAFAAAPGDFALKLVMEGIENHDAQRH
ncbi:MAG: tRNA lysidine(34) synthetase TilS [Oscillospiraceae bacterium]|nr:tRNA lysidine(34) synthetase TilS [Oscillospiraceae bacterium]